MAGICLGEIHEVGIGVLLGGIDESEVFPAGVHAEPPPLHLGHVAHQAEQCSLDVRGPASPL